MEAIVLAGGLGTRLSGVIDNLPKCMAPVADKPFLYYLLTYLAESGVTAVIFSLGYKHEVVEAWVQQHPWPFKTTFTVESTPLGTGGAIKAAMTHATEEQVLVLNGDTFFHVDLSAFYAFHTTKQAAISLALKPMVDFDRYGNVVTDASGRICLFQEKMPCDKGLINGGVYVINRNSTLFDAFEGVFSFETAVLQQNVQTARFYGFESEGYFIDIGIPDDYRKANQDVAFGCFTTSPPTVITGKRVIFLDRDGVINEYRPNDYVKKWSEFVFLPGVLEALRLLGRMDVAIFVVTNQRGVGKGLMNREDLEDIHRQMLEAVTLSGGRIDRVYSCTDTDTSAPNRKPNPGMALQAKNDYPTLDFASSIMVGDSPIDVEFGQRLGMKTVLIDKTGDVDSLLTFAKRFCTDK